MERATPVGSNFASLTFSEMNALWEMSKQAEKTKGIPS
jgi:hypothetical protein